MSITLMTYNTNYKTVKVKPNAYPLSKGNLQRFIWCNIARAGWLTKDCSNYTIRIDNIVNTTIIFPSTWNMRNKTYAEWYNYIMEKLHEQR